jgi:hypothetical protein
MRCRVSAVAVHLFCGFDCVRHLDNVRHNDYSRVYQMIVFTLILPYVCFDPDRSKARFEGGKDIGTHAVADHPSSLW